VLSLFIKISSSEKTVKKKLILASSLLTVMLPSTVYSQSSPVTNQPGCIRDPQTYIAPENLATMAYQGYLEKQGIPGYETFTVEFESGQITSEKVVQAAVDGCLLSNKYGVPSHSNYIQDVQEQIQLLIDESKR
jgi:hypothetical protein